MDALTYYIWNDIVYGVIEIHASLFEAMHLAAKKQNLSSDLIEELKAKDSKDIREGDWRFSLRIELYEDDIGGFKINLLAAETYDAFQQAIANASKDHGISMNDLRNFEIEHGIDIDEDIIEAIEESYNIFAEETNEEVLFELVVFDSDDIDDSGKFGWGGI
ncbi:MAG: hypothetical protein MUO26_07665 [Methanotrichaceae archaeon]|nr:hypothetical protein [Methanotrichaceae archaeon]